MFQCTLDARSKAKKDIAVTLCLLIIPSLFIWMILDSFSTGEYQLGAIIWLPIMVILFLLGIAVFLSTIVAAVFGGEYRLYVNATHVGYSLPRWSDFKQRGNFELEHNEISHILLRSKKGKKKIKRSVVAQDGTSYPLRLFSADEFEQFIEHCKNIGLNILDESVSHDEIDEPIAS